VVYARLGEGRCADVVMFALRPAPRCCWPRPRAAAAAPAWSDGPPDLHVDPARPPTRDMSWLLGNRGYTGLPPATSTWRLRGGDSKR